MKFGSWEIDEQTLLPRIVDQEAFQEEFCDDPYLDAIVALWSGSTEEIPAKLTGDDSPRARVLVAESHARAGEFAVSCEKFADLIDEFEGSAREAVIRQHYGKALFLAGGFEDAREQFTKACELRMTADVDDDLIRSSTFAIKRCDEEIAGRRRLSRDH